MSENLCNQRERRKQTFLDALGGAQEIQVSLKLRILDFKLNY